jgi:6-phosphogluconolactonase
MKPRHTQIAVESCAVTISRQAISRKPHLSGYLFLALMLLSIAPQKLHAGLAAGRYAYVVDVGANRVDEFSINPVTGALVPLPGACANIPTAAGPTSAAVDPTGRFLYVTNNGANTITLFHINPLTGCLVRPIVRPAVGVGPISLGITANGAFLYVSDTSGIVEGYAINPLTGVLVPVPGNPFFAGPNPAGLAVDPFRSYVYVVNNVAAGTVTAFSFNPVGTLIPVAGSPFPTGPGPFSLAVDPVGQFLMVTSFTASALFSHPINPGTGAIGPPQIAPTPAGPLGVAVDPFGQFAYVADHLGAGSVSSFTVNAATGLPLPNLAPVAAAAGPVGATMDQSGRFLYVANNVGNSVSGYAINPLTGASVNIAGSPWATGVGPFAIATTP